MREAAPDLPCRGRPELDRPTVVGGRIVLRARTTGRSARCPLCSRPSGWVHSHYARTAADLPRHGVAVALEVRARRFFCDETRCERRIFCERLPDVVRAGLTEEWSNGPVEGFIHKLKLLKRQGYGRSNFDLLKARTLVA